MAFTGSFICTSYKKEVLDGTHTSAHTYRLGLYLNTASLTAATTVYSATNEVATGGGYTQNNATSDLAGFTTGTLGTWAYLTFTDKSWASSTITARGALIYNTSATNKAVAVLDFGADKSSSSGTFTVDFGNASTAVAGMGTGLTWTTGTNVVVRNAGSWISDGYQAGHTIITNDTTNIGPYTIVSIDSATQMTLSLGSGASIASGGPRTCDVKEVVLAW